VEDINECCSAAPPDLESFLDYLEVTVDEISCKFPTSEIVMVGDFNQLLDTDLTQRTGLTQIVDQPTRESNILDRIFEASPMYTGVKVVTSTVKSDHLAIIAYTGSQPKDINKKLFYNIARALLTNILLFWHTSLTSARTMSLMLPIHKLLLIYFMLLYCRC